MFEYASGNRFIYVGVDISTIYMCYSQGDGFNTSLSRLLQLYCTHSQQSLIDGVFVVNWLCYVMFPGTVMCHLGRR